MPTPVMRRSFPRSFRRKKDRDLGIILSGPFLIIVFHCIRKDTPPCAISREMVCDVMPAVLPENLPQSSSQTPDPGSPGSQRSACRATGLRFRASQPHRTSTIHAVREPAQPGKTKALPFPVSGFGPEHFRKKAKNCLQAALPAPQATGRCPLPLSKQSMA